MLSFTEENYLKAIYKIAERNGDQNISTKAIAEELEQALPRSRT
jgi:Mn-dependent DtxR family transcriptional regulator